MNIELAGNLIVIVVFAIAAAIIGIIFVMLLHQPVHESYTYCYDCKYGLCTADPKTGDCFKYKDELAEKQCKKKKEVNSE